jgi:YhcN/YlaJ family sporulation lipoprotein
MNKRLIYLTSMGCIVLAVTACGYNQTKQEGPKVQQYGMNRTGDGVGLNHMGFGKDSQRDRINKAPSKVDNGISMHSNQRMEMSHRLANNIAELKDVKSANVLLTDDSAYVAVVLHGRQTAALRNLGTQSDPATSGAISDYIQNQISDECKIMYPRLRNVYISANPDFVERMSEMAKEGAEGKAIQGYMAEFNAMVQRIFPASSGDLGK